MCLLASGVQAEAVPARIADATGALREGPARAAQLRALADLELI